MRIGIDGRMLFMSGIGTYLRNLLAGLARLDAAGEYVLFLRPADRERFAAPGANFRIVTADAEPYSLAEQTLLPRLARREGLDLIHHPHYFTPWFGRTPMVATVHDLIHQLLPEMFRLRAVSWLAWAVAWRTASRARLVLTVSEHTRHDLVFRLGVPAAKVRVTYNALPPGWGEGPAPPLLPAVEALGGAPFFFYAGNHKRHKNLPLLIEAFDWLRRQEGGRGARLVLTGARDDLDSELRRRGLGGEAVFLGEVPNAALEGVYRAARALVFPSRYEGFGLPPLEAMGCGVPPIVSDAASLPEVVGEAGVIVPVGKAQPLGEAMLRLLADDRLHGELSARARERARRFSWRALAEGTLQVYREAAAGAGGRP
ncbi:MAG: glycosyltransferase family 4 protein [Candidatus Tectomicrobia bacterium]|uniref:Glycosyltransferase family 4 protein n=1 Tax=Tectimicrobiota bacterium TaxID=2528274 RepID=A0A932ZT13_UNCTE|nr:glycosyltransferase family 4 protein [Candidatus Tectomicrobia bacterium]